LMGPAGRRGGPVPARTRSAASGPPWRRRQAPRRRPGGPPRPGRGPVGAGARSLPARWRRNQRSEPVHRAGHRDHRRCGDGPGGPAVRALPGGVPDVRRSGPRPGPRGRCPCQRRGQGHHGDRGGPMSSRRTAVLLGAAALALTTACGAGASGDPGTDDPAGDPASDSGTDQTLTVFAAASLAGPMDDLLDMFAEDPPDVTIQPAVYDGSSTLVTQLSEGAHADVLATANTSTMDDLVAAFPDQDYQPTLFATNTLVIAVPKGNPLGITSLADLNDATFVTCAPEVPCGAAATELF